MAFSNGQLVNASDLNNFSVTTVTTTSHVTVGGNLTVTGSIAAGAGIPDSIPGRLTLTSGTPVTTADVTAATTVYYALDGSNLISLYNGTGWQIATISELSVAVPATTSQMYDVFVDFNAGTPALALVAWTNDTTRATALARQDGRLVLNGTPARRYVGSFRTTGVSGQTEDSMAKRYLWNYYNRVPRAMRVVEATNTWGYDTATWRQANGAAANQVDCVIGVAEVLIQVDVVHSAEQAASGAIYTGIGEDSTSAPASGLMGIAGQGAVGSAAMLSVRASLQKYPAVGRHFYAWLERGSGVATTWHGDNGDATLEQNGISGWIQG